MEDAVERPSRRTTGLSRRISQRLRPAALPRLDQVAVIDRANQDYVSGWALHASGIVRIDVFIDGRRAGSASYGSYRADVAARFPGIPGASHTGFTYLIDPEDLAESASAVVSVHVVAVAEDESTCSSFSVQIPTARPPSRYAAAASASSDLDPVRVAHPSPFPRPVEEALRALRGEGPEDDQPWSAERIDEAVDDLILAREVASKDTAGLFRYFSYLREMWLRLAFNAEHFPALNRTATADGKDLVGVATSPVELFVICHHLASLRSRGVTGSVCEFGCFKGFSTAALSEACGRLGFTLDVFDSFAGLPESESTFYRAGEFKGSREEVEANLREFGNPSVVRIHEGFFADTVGAFDADRIACLWMDVDLEVSAQDALSVFPLLDPRGCLFSDECSPEDFLSGRIDEVRHPDRVIAPICEAFRADGRDVTGRFVAGHTGCFRDPKQSLPVLMSEPLLRLRDALLE